MITVQRAILSYMSTRCQVSSQHKLPGKQELYETVTIGFLFDRKTIDAGIEGLLSEGKLFAYGPYLSDHAIDVM